MNEDNEDGAPNRCTEPQFTRESIDIKTDCCINKFISLRTERLLITDYYGMDSDSKILKIIDHLIARQKLKKDRE